MSKVARAFGKFRFEDKSAQGIVVIGHQWMLDAPITKGEFNHVVPALHFQQRVPENHHRFTRTTFGRDACHGTKDSVFNIRKVHAMNSVSPNN